MTVDLEENAKAILSSSLGLEKEEKLLIVTDPDRHHIAEALFAAGADLGADSVFTMMSPRESNGQEPPEHVTAAMVAADVIVVPSTHSMTHTQARRRATDSGARMATMPGITEDMFREGAITADYAEVEPRTKELAQRLQAASEALIVAEGYELRMNLEGREAIASTGVFHEPGTAGNLPSGEAFIAPAEGTAEGELLVDGSIAGIGRLKDPVLLKISEGNLSSAAGTEGDRLLELLDRSPEGRNVAELGIGTNDKARLTGVTLEDEKIYGTVHVAFGSNDTFGGTVKAGVHLDAVVLHPTLYLDDELVVDEGRIRTGS